MVLEAIRSIGVLTSPFSWFPCQFPTFLELYGGDGGGGHTFHGLKNEEIKNEENGPIE